MITLMVLNNVLHELDAFYFSFMGWVVQPFNVIGDYIVAFQVPQTLLNIWGIAVYFLPIGTVSVLFTFTVILILFKLFAAVLHFFSLGILFKS